MLKFLNTSIIRQEHAVFIQIPAYNNPDLSGG